MAISIRLPCLEALSAYMLVNTKDNVQRCTKYTSQPKTITLGTHTLYNTF